jgi:archaellum component FlaC
MPELPDFKEGTFLKAEDLVALVEYVRLLKAEMEEQVSLLTTEIGKQVSLLRTEIEGQVGPIKADIKSQVGLLKAEINEQVSPLKAEIKEQVSLLKAEIEELRKKYEELNRRYEPLPELDFNPKVLLFKEAQEQALFPWSVRYKSIQGAYFEVPRHECKVGVADPGDASAIEIRGDVLIPLRIGRNKVKVDVSFPVQNQYFEIEVKRFAS